MGAPVFPSIGLQEAKLPLYDPAAGDQNGRHIHPPDAHQVGRHALVAAGKEHTAVKRRGKGFVL